jgi:hypothetical protein
MILIISNSINFMLTFVPCPCYLFPSVVVPSIDIHVFMSHALTLLWEYGTKDIMQL